MRSQLINPHHCSSIHARLTVGSRPLWKSDKKQILFYFDLTFDVQHHKSSMMMRNAWAHGLLGKIAFRPCGRMKLIRKGPPPPPGQVLQVERNTEVCLCLRLLRILSCFASSPRHPFIVKTAPTLLPLLKPRVFYGLPCCLQALSEISERLDDPVIAARELVFFYYYGCLSFMSFF